MFINSSPEDVLQRLKKPPRIPIACRGCRKRKVKCEVDKKNSKKPCKRCAQRHLTCEYIAVAEDPDAASSSSSSSSQTPPKIRKELPSCNTTSYIYRPQSHSPSRNLFDDPGYGSEETNFYTAGLFYANSSGSSSNSSLDRSSGTLDRPSTFPNHDYIHLPLPVPQHLAYETASMQAFMALSRSSSTLQRRDDFNPKNILHQIYQQPSNTPHTDPLPVTVHYLDASEVAPLQISSRKIKSGQSLVNPEAKSVQKQRTKVLIHLVFTDVQNLELVPPSPDARCLPLYATLETAKWTSPTRTTIIRRRARHARAPNSESVGGDDIL
ncbi:hypothetical protein C8J56DRAFT_1063157 [Mycena floridula]|nr:hypothetical protein C8J56DRAFT_1063157 [Mycena floridula]